MIFYFLILVTRIVISLVLASCVKQEDENNLNLNPLDPLEFQVYSADGTAISGQVDFGSRGKSKDVLPTVILVHGTGLFDRDASFGISKTDDDKLFKTIARSLTKKNVNVVRYDRRGVVFQPKAGGKRLLTDISGSSSTTTLWQDLGAVYDWVSSSEGLNSTCIALLGHSEGMAHIGRLAESGARKPSLVIGIGALLESPKSVFKWQSTGRDVYSLKKMDENSDGVTSNDEVSANWQKTPSAVFGQLDVLLNPDGEWSEEALENVEKVQLEIYQVGKDAALKIDDLAPYPNETTPMARYSWWKHWYTDDTPVAQNLSLWDTSFLFYFGGQDSQVNFERQVPHIETYLGGNAKYFKKNDLGHSLGKHVLFAPIDPEALEDVATKVVESLKENCG